MAQLNEVKYGHTQRPAPAADDRGRSGSGSLRNGQIGQGSPALPGENDYNSSEVKYGKPEPRNLGTGKNDIGLLPNARKPEHLAGDSDTQRICKSDVDNQLDNERVNNGQKDQTTGMGDAQQHSDNRAHPDGITRESGDDSRLVSGATDVGNESGEVKVKPVPQPQLRLVNPVPRQSKKQKSETGFTGKKTVNVKPVPQSVSKNNSNRIHPPTLSGYKWKPSGLTGWELYSRKPSVSVSGKRSSKAKYIAYYSQQAVERMINEREKAANARTA